MPFDTDSLAPLVGSIYRPLRNNKLKLICYGAFALLGALLLSATFGQHYDGSSQKLRGAPKRREATLKGASPVATTTGEGDLKDPYANRPRIRTKNGHLVIEASQDKNIDFRTSGSRGTVTINGHKLDQLLNVTKALEKSSKFMTSGGSFAAGSTLTGGDPYDALLQNLFGTGERLTVQEKILAELKTKLADVDSRLASLKKKLSKKMNLLASVSKQQDSMLAKLKRNECFHPETGQPSCKNGATCVDAYDGFKCLCTANYEGPTCAQDVDECLKYQGTELGCQNGAKCINLAGSYRCECPAQFHGVHCTETHDDCALSSSSSLCGFGKCVNLARSTPNQPHYECICDQGWTTDGTNPACVIDVNECMAGQAPPPVNASSMMGQDTFLHQWSDPLIRSSSPAGGIGWTQVMPSPMAAYPCSQNPYVECTNLPGSFQCGPCPAGYTGNGRICRDLDECQQNNGGCSMEPLVECINTQGSRRCGLCPPGYTGDGVTCSRVSACTAEVNGGCHPYANCIELAGLSLSSRLCVCKYPFVGDGTGLEGCKLPPGTGGPLPVRAPPTSGDNRTSAAGTSAQQVDRTATVEQQQQEKQDDCNPNPCLNGGQCLYTGVSFECICPPAWSGSLCLESTRICGGNFFTSQGRLQFTLSGSSYLNESNGRELMHDAEQQVTQQVSTSGGRVERKLKCKWQLSVLANMSIKLDLSLSNKLNPSQKVQMFLANSTSRSSRRRWDVPTCAEYLDIWDRLDLESVQPDAERRLLARFCSGSGSSSASMVNVDPVKSVAIMTESHGAQLEYSFTATRTQFGEPSLAFNLSWLSVAPPCGGEFTLSSANPSGSISSPKFPEFYEAGTECRYLLRATSGQRLRLQFAELSLLSSGTRAATVSSASGLMDCADSLTIIDGAIGPDRPVLFRHCANNATLQTRAPTSALVSSSSTVEVILASNFNSSSPLLRPKQRKGFLLTFTSEPASPGCGGLYTRKAGVIKSGDYEPAPPESAADQVYLALQLSMYMTERGLVGGSDSQRQVMSSVNVWRPISTSNGPSWRQGQADNFRSRWYKSRCEYELRPAGQQRNHKVALDWLEMPRDTNHESANIMSIWSRRIRCSKSRLIVYDGDPLDGSNRTEIVTFCSGDQYNASSPLFAPIVSSGHLLYLVYETTSDDSNFLASPSNQPDGFKLHYSTICSAVYNQLSDRIQVEITSDVPECVYHIILPPHNTISLQVEPQMSESLMTLNGQCAAQAIFMDGALVVGKQALVGAERELRGYSFGSSGFSSGGSLPNQTSRAGITGDAIQIPATLPTSSSTTGNDSYWQYSSSQVHDIKEFEVCKLAVLGFDSIWNHLSILFRLATPSVATGSSSLSESRVVGPVQLMVRYRSEASCGGVISEPSSGKIRLDTSRQIPTQSPKADSKQVAKRNDERPCSWVFRAAPNQVIEMKFDAPFEEIKKRFNDWLTWSTSPSLHVNLTSKPKFNCSQVYKEAIEIYEPALNRTRQLCPLDLLSGSTASVWLTQSSIALIRLRNTTDQAAANATTVGHWPGLKPLPLLGDSAFSVAYKFTIAKGRQCGGWLLHDSGLIRTPRFPLFYPPQTYCEWVIQTQPNQQIRLNITKFELESSPNCLFDYLELRNGPNANSPLIGRFCGRDLQSKVLVSHSSFMWLCFKSDGHLSQSGFEIYYDEAQTGCGGRLTTASGQIDSPNFPLPFAHSADCEWTIELSKSNKVELTIELLDLNSGSSESSCLNDTRSNYLAVYDSGAVTGKPLWKYCHQRQLSADKRKIISTSNKLFIVFKSQALDSGRGFRLTYKTLCSGLELVGFRGVIESPGYPLSYPARISCNWTLRAPLGSNLSIAITELDLEESSSNEAEIDVATSVPIIDYSSRTINKSRWRCSEDALVVWAVYGSSKLAASFNKTTSKQMDFAGNATQLASQAPQNSKMVRFFCGQLNKVSEADRHLELNTNVAYLSFESDRSVEGRGFRLEWSSEGCGGSQVGDSVEPLKYREPSTASGRPTECLWTFELAHLVGTIEFTISSDMRSTVSGVTGDKRDNCESGSLILYDGLTDKAPVLDKNCDSQVQRKLVSTSGGQALVRFFTNGSGSFGRNFQLTGRLIHRDDCLSSVFDIQTPYNQRAGYKQSPLYPDLYDATQYHCYGQISTNTGRVRLQLEELNIPIDSSGGSQQQTGLLSKEQCKNSTNYMLIRGLQSNSGGNGEEILCGQLDLSNPADAARSSLIMEQEAAWLEFHTSKAELRGRWKFSYDRLCGSFVQIYFERDFSTPNYPETPQWSSISGTAIDSQRQQQQEDRACIWRLSTNYIHSTSGRDKKLHFNVLNFIESSSSSSNFDCVRVYEGVDLSLAQSRFNLTDLDTRLAPKIKICKQTDLTHRSLTYVSQGAEITVLITGNAVVKFRVKPFENYCGAELHLDKAEFASLGYPQPYAPNLDCSYFIMAAPGAKINLRFQDFDLPEGEFTGVDDSSGNSKSNGSSCDNVDYVEIRQLPLKKAIEHRLKQRGLDYFSDSDDDDSTTSDDSNLVLAGSSNSTGASTNSTLPTKVSRFSTKRWSFLFKLYNLFNDRRSSSNLIPLNSRISLDDFHESSVLLGRFCGRKAPQLAPELMRDQILVRFRSHAAPTQSQSNKRAPRGFLIEYKLDYGGLIKLTGDKEPLEGLIGSPRYPGRSSSQRNIIWNFITKLDYVIQFELVSLDLGSPHQDCTKDTLNIFDGTTLTTAPLLSRLCGQMTFKSLSWSNWARRSMSSKPTFDPTPLYSAHEPQVRNSLIRLVRSSSNVAAVVFDNRNGNGSFLLRYKAVSLAKLEAQKNKSSVVNNDEAITSDDQQVDLSIETLDSGRNASKSCSGSYLLTLGATNGSQVMLSSPNWPKLPASNIECHWLVYTHDNTDIKLNFIPPLPADNSATNTDQSDGDDPRSFGPSESCFEPGRTRGAFVAVHDGASRLSPLISRFCLPAPLWRLQSTGRHMLIRYVNLDSLTSTGGTTTTTTPATPRASLFKAQATVSECGGQYHILRSASISDHPENLWQRYSGQRKNYTNNLNCKYYLFAGSKDEVLMINDRLSSFNLAKEPTNANCTVGDYLEIRDLPIQSDQLDYSRSNSGKLIGRFCAGRPLESFETAGSAISMEFRTDNENVAPGWKLYVESAEPRLSCPKGYMSLYMDAPYWRITSPNWPHGFQGKRNCRYLLMAPNNQSIQARFVRFRRPHTDEDHPERCTDSLTYLADNEAAALRYKWESIIEAQSPLSGARMRELVRTVACNQSSVSPLASSDRLDDLLASSSDGEDINPDYSKKISSEEYFRLLELPQYSFELGPTRSHVLLIEYEARNLLPNEGFVAIIRSVPNIINRCGGDITHRRLGDFISAVDVDPSNNSTQLNLIVSGRFGVETKMEDSEYIQCDWSLKSFTIGEDYFGIDAYMMMQQNDITYRMTPSAELGNFTTSFLVFDVIEIPPVNAGQSLVDLEWSGQKSVSRSISICGLNRLMMSDVYFGSTILACGNLTNSFRWIILDPFMSQITLRTKNLRLNNNKDSTDIYRGVRGRLYEKVCLQLERLVGEGIRIRSHVNYPNSSYQPGICQWAMRLSGGDYHLWFDNVRFRLPSSKSLTTTKRLDDCDPAGVDDLDYLEIKASASGDSPVISRICAYNQMNYTQKKPLVLRMRTELKLVFVAGVSRLASGLETYDDNKQPANSSSAFGFDLEVVRVRNISQFCRRESMINIYSFIKNRDNKFYDHSIYAIAPSLSSFLYPKNTHCEIPMSLDDSQRFNFTFRGMFDMESSPDCQSDYLQIDDIITNPDDVTSMNTTGKTAKAITKGKKTQIVKVDTGGNRIGRWCGRTKPTGSFVSKSEKVRITFHTNDRVEGKGFQLEYSVIQAATTTSNSSTSIS